MVTALLNLAVNVRQAMPTDGQLTIETANVELGDDYVKKYDELARRLRHVLGEAPKGS